MNISKEYDVYISGKLSIAHPHYLIITKLKMIEEIW